MDERSQEWMSSESQGSIRSQGSGQDSESTSGEQGIRSLPVGFVPTPTREYRTHRKTMKSTVQPGTPVSPMVPGAEVVKGGIPIPLPIPSPHPVPLLIGPRVLMWKQDPSVGEIGVRKAFLPGFASTGPKDGRVSIEGLPPVTRNAFGDFIQNPGSDAFDAVHTYAVVRQTLTMYQRSSGKTLPWQWNSSSNTDGVSVYPHMTDVMNAFYSRSQQALKFGDFIPPGSTPSQRVYTCRSLDIVAHETGHCILDGLKPGWLLYGNPPQTGGLHESFGDLSAIFLALSQLDQVEAIIAQTKADLHDKTFLSDMAEQFGLALGRPNGLRNADNDLKLSQTGTEVHAISQVFTGGIYDVLADIFSFERNSAKRDDAAVLYEVGQYLCGLVLRSYMAAPSVGATYADVVNQMLSISAGDGKPIQYRNFIRNRFTLREVVVSPTPLTENVADGLLLSAYYQDSSEASQDRRTCCGTMQLDEYIQQEGGLWMEIEELKLALTSAGAGKSGRGRRSAS